MSRIVLLTFHRPAVSAALIAAVVAALLLIPSAQTADAAAPLCFGKRATIVGTARGETIRGTRRADVIVAKGGRDTVIGRGGGDRICAGRGADVVRSGAGLDRVKGGSGNDRLEGGDSSDLLRGQSGDDVILGGARDDTIDGGADVDQCDQGTGSGTVTNCENDGTSEPPPPPPATSADLGVSVRSPRRAASGEITFTVRVVNNGPDATAYTLKLSLRSVRATCTTPDWVGDQLEAELVASDSRSAEYAVTCTKKRKGARVEVRASVSAATADPLADNNSAVSKTMLR
jgi:hypothetical protein